MRTRKRKSKRKIKGMSRMRGVVYGVITKKGNDGNRRVNAALKKAVIG